MRRSPALVATALLALAGLGSPLLAQAPDVLETEVKTFRLPVVVTTGRNKFVAGLKRQDFVLTEDGVPQTITAFDQTSAPLNVVFMVDASPSMESKLVPVKKALTQFIRRLRPEDRAKIVRFNVRPETLQEFTSSREALLAAVQKIDSGGV